MSFFGMNDDRNDLMKVMNDWGYRMATFDIADKACRLADNAREIAEIQKIIGDYNQGQIIDRQ